MRSLRLDVPIAPALGSFVGDVAVLQRACSDPATLANAVRDRLAALTHAAWLPDTARHGSPERYTQHVLYVAPDRSFSVVSLVWYPGQRTPIHDHVAWCVVGVVEGRESQTLYHLMSSAKGDYLIEAGREVCLPGDRSALVPPEENIHVVENDGEVKAISIHVYGADIETLGSSIHRTFDHLPLGTASDARASRRMWRK